SVLVDDKTAKIETCGSITPQVDQLVTNLLRDSHAVGSGSRVLLQRLRIEQIGIHEVLYRCGKAGQRQLWIYGDKEQVHAPNAPWAWWRALFIVLGFFGVFALIAALLYYFLFMTH